MANPNNLVTITGRLARDLTVKTNSDHSTTILGTLMVDENFTNRDGKVASQPINFQAFIPASVNGLGGWGNVGKGDLLSMAGRLTNPSYEKDGQMVYPGMRLEIDGFPQFLESRAVTQARRNQNTAAAPQENPHPAAQPQQHQAPGTQPAAAPAAAPAQIPGVPAGWTTEQYITHLEQQKAAQHQVQPGQPGQPAVVEPGNYNDAPF